jgi:hypothetical protein
MTPDHPAPESRAAVHAHASTLFASLELSRSRWLVTVSAPGSDKLSKHALDGGDGGVLLALLARLRAAAARRLDAAVRVIVIQEAGLDGFWIHRLLVANGIESHIVDPASIAVSRRHRRAKTDAIDGETLLRTLMAWARGASARGCGRRARRKKINGVSVASAARCSRNASSTRTGSAACSPGRASSTTIRCIATVLRVSTNW